MSYDTIYLPLRQFGYVYNRLTTPAAAPGYLYHGMLQTKEKGLPGGERCCCCCCCCCCFYLTRSGCRFVRFVLRLLLFVCAASRFCSWRRCSAGTLPCSSCGFEGRGTIRRGGKTTVLTRRTRRRYEIIRRYEMLCRICIQHRCNLGNYECYTSIGRADYTVPPGNNAS